jgi:hypothetical protein
VLFPVCFQCECNQQLRIALRYPTFFPPRPHRLLTIAQCSILSPSDFDWSAKPTASEGPRKLELTGADVAELDGLGNLDISFDASPSDKIHVRIHPSSAPSSWSTSPSATEKSDMSSSYCVNAHLLGQQNLEEINGTTTTENLWYVFLCIVYYFFFTK